MKALLIVLMLLTAPLLAATPDYIGRPACASCHEKQNAAWVGSHHDLAMQEASPQTVLGDFNDVRFEWQGQTNRFFRKDGRFMVHTDAADGQMQDFEIKYCFGVYPLQQYLIEFPGGRLQALDIAWDARLKDQGGQRWFHLHPDERIKHKDVLHWTGLALNWNSMCADCHSTNLRKGYDAASGAYHSTWSDMDVSCEACHGPGSAHKQWAETKAQGKDSQIENLWLTLLLDERKSVSWPMDDKTGKLKRSTPNTKRKELDVCAKCHSRRSQLMDDFTPGQSFLNAYRPSLLQDGLYFPDGQIQDEVYEWGSFLQSRMYEAGVTCSDCHEPHSSKLRLAGDAVCQQCHAKDKYASTTHHRHQQDSQGASCISCHAPSRTYMGVHARHDHGFRVPRPDLSEKLGTPNACNQCHQDKPAQWASAHLVDWYGKQPTGLQQFAESLGAGQSGAANALPLLAELAFSNQPSIARASALAMFSGGGQQAGMILQQKLNSDDPLEILGALEGLANFPAQIRVLALPLVWDERRAIRIQAARLVVNYPRDRLKPDQAKVLDAAIKEYVDIQTFNAEWPESQLNLAGLYAETGQTEKAESAFRKALALRPGFVPAYLNFAQSLTEWGRETESEGLLRAAIGKASGNADLRHALGLSLVRQKKMPQALDELSQASALDPSNNRYAYVYAVALQSSGKLADAILVLEKSLQTHPDDVETLFALAGYLIEAKRKDKAEVVISRLEALMPGQPVVEQLNNQLRQGTQ